jgi:hypothetical protein
LLETEARGPRFGIPLTRRFEGATEARLGFAAADGVAERAVDAVLERERDTLDVFFCSAGAG